MNTGALCVFANRVGCPVTVDEPLEILGLTLEFASVEQDSCRTAALDCEEYLEERALGFLYGKITCSVDVQQT